MKTSLFLAATLCDMHTNRPPVWKGPWLYHKNVRIICVFPPMISMYTVKKFYAVALFWLLAQQKLVPQSEPALCPVVL